MYVYILSNHGEGGAEEVHATLGRAGLSHMLERLLPGYREDNQSEARKELALLLDKSDEELSDSDRCRHGRELMTGWGGIQLHVVKLK